MAKLSLEVGAWREPLAALFRSAAGRRVRLTLVEPFSRRVFEGTIPSVTRWRSLDEPCLQVKPGSLDGVHVLADLVLALREQNRTFFLSRRKWYEELELDAVRLGPGPLEVELDVIE